MLMTVPSNDKIAMQKLTAYAALSSFHKMLSLPDMSLLMLSSLLSLSSSQKRSIFRGLKHKYNKSLLSLSSRCVETGCASTEQCRMMFRWTPPPALASLGHIAVW
jgi:hypothetical protein